MKKEVIFRVVVILLLAACFITAAVLDYYRGKDKRVVFSHRNAHHPVINDLFARKIRQGQPVDRLLAFWPPTRYSKHDNFITLYYVKSAEESDSCCEGYSTSIRLVALDGKLVKALADEGVLAEIEYVFFNGLSQAQEDIYWTSRFHSLSANK
jgi:hypothetical protein